MKIKVQNYTFDKTTKTITFSDYGSLNLDQVLLVTNVTDNIIIYNFADPTLGGSMSSNQLTLEYDTTSMDDNDDLQIFIEDHVQPAIASKQDVAIAGLANLLLELQAKADLTETQPVSVQSLPGGLATSAKQDTIITALASLITELQLKADLSETQPVSLASQPLPSNAAQETGGNLATIAGKDFATQTTLNAILQKLIAAPATEATTAAILAKLIAAPATEAKQDALNAKDFATQTTLAQLLAKVIAAPSTEAKQDTIITALGNILSKIIATPATEAKQDTMIVGLNDILTKIIAAPATEAKQDALNSKVDQIVEVQQTDLLNQQQIIELQETLQELISRLDFLPSVRGVAADLRVTLLSGIVTTVSTVTTVATVTSVTNLANIGNIPAVNLIPANMNVAAILGNINNTIG